MTLKFAKSLVLSIFLMASQVHAGELQVIAEEAYTYLYPLVTMEITRKVSTNSPVGKTLGRGPMNTIVNVREFPPVDFKDVVRPNFDTLYSVAWIDLSKGPMILSVPDTSDRYYLLPLLDMWSNVFAAPGKRTSGTAAKTFAIVQQNWKGSLPKNVEVIVAPTSVVWMIGRTQTNSPEDYPFVHAIQDGFKLMTLTDYTSGKTTPVVFTEDKSVDMKTPPLDQVNNMAPAEFFKIASELIKNNPPQLTDWSIIERMKKIGFVAGQSYDLNKQSTEVQSAVATGSKNGLANMFAKIPTLARIVNGWQMNTDTMGVYGNYYLKRSIVAMLGLGANQPEDAIYPLAIADSKGDVLLGENNYVMHFSAAELPPVNAFWSITMYDKDGFQVANEINRYAIGDRDQLKYNSDGSLDIYIQNKNPGGDKTSNWLPAPASGKLGITMRLYAPLPQAIDGRWAPVGIVKQ